MEVRAATWQVMEKKMRTLRVHHLKSDADSPKHWAWTVVGRTGIAGTGAGAGVGANNWGWRQLGERQTEDLKVPGSI